MFRRHLGTLLFFICMHNVPGLLVPILGQADAHEILREAEMYRAPWPGMELKANLIAHDKRGRMTKSTYRVMLKDEIKTLAGFIEPKFEKGNMLLMIGDDLWYYVKDTRRPIRITPIQRLSGSVSYGDLARLHWTNDYTVDTMESVKDPVMGKRALRLDLQARSSGATYQKIKLYVENDTKKPLKCDVFLLSGKHFKTIEFTRYETIGGKLVNVEMKYTDHLMKATESTLVFEDLQEKPHIAERFFIKTTLPDISKEFIK